MLPCVAHSCVPCLCRGWSRAWQGKSSYFACPQAGQEGQESVGAVFGPAGPCLLRWETPQAECTVDVHSFPMPSLKAEGGFLRPLLLYHPSAEEYVVLERALQRVKTGRPSHQLKTMALNFFLTQRDGQSSAVSTDWLQVLFPARFLVLVRGFNTLIGSMWLRQYEALLSVTSLRWFLPSP